VVKDKEGEIRYEVPYDKLVIAVGCYSASLGIEGVSRVSISTHVKLMTRSRSTLTSSRTSEMHELSVRECCMSMLPTAKGIIDETGRFSK
jgi:NADPH-dependent 2,4-dienoyl-CoA reductase/sulfur reductase-like enzyme